MKKAKVLNIDKITKALHKMGEISNKDLKPISAENGEIMANAMRALVPVETGRLKNAIKVMKANDEAYPKTVLVGIDFTPDGLGTMTIAGLASVVEFGTVAVRKPKKGGLMRFQDKSGNWVSGYEFDGVPARPFIRPALDMTREQVLDGIKNDTYKFIMNKAKKLKLI